MILPVGFGSSAGGTPANAISRSLRFNSADSAYLNRTPASAGNRRTFTWSGWVKRGALSSSASYFLFAAGSFAGSTNTSIRILNDSINIYWGGAGGPQWTATAVLRDPSAWYHLVFAFDTTQATFGDRLKLYVNGVQSTVWSLQETGGLTAQNSDLYINNNQQHNLGASGTPNNYFNGYMTEINFIDGLTPNTTTRTVSGVTQTILTELGQFNTNTGVWEPAAWTRAFGTNGFYVNFSDNSNTTAATLGKDYSGNGNNWTPNNFSVTAGAGNDSLVDSPTAYGTDTGVGGEVRGNYCTMNPLTVPTLPTINNGNLDVAATSGVRIAQGTFQFPSSGKWYFECTFNNASSGVNGMLIGITSPTRSPNATRSTAGAYFFYASSSGLLNSNGTDVVTGLSTISANEVFKLAVDIDNSKVWIGRGSNWYNSSGGTTGDPAAGTNPTFSISAIGLTPMSGFDASSVSLSMNFGQRSFNTTAPSGFKALCTQNLDTPVIGATSSTQANDYFNPVLYTGTGSSLSVTGVGFQPDWVWIKGRSGATDHGLYDAVRGVQKQLESNTTTAETTETTGLTAFGSDGFTVGALAQLNTSSATYVSWNWKANGAGSTNSNGTAKSSAVTVDSSTDTVTWNSHGMSDGQKIGFFASVMPGGLSAGTLYFVRDASTNTFKVAATSGGAAINITSNGTSVTCHTTLTSTVSANTTSEFSIVTYTGTGANTTVEHGLDIAPTFIIVKQRNTTRGWPCLVKAANSGNGQNGRLNLDETANYADNVEFWNNTSPTSKVFSIGISVGTNQSSGTYVAYCFAPVAGYSAFGSYVGNAAADGPFIYTGFRPEYVLIKASTSTGDWIIEDTVRSPYNVSTNYLVANTTGIETTGQLIDFLSNGFKIRVAVSSAMNGSGTTYIYAAFAENPFKYSLAR